jgi:hypothetical protein
VPPVELASFIELVCNEHNDNISSNPASQRDERAYYSHYPLIKENSIKHTKNGSRQDKRAEDF